MKKTGPLPSVEEKLGVLDAALVALEPLGKDLTAITETRVFIHKAKCHSCG